MNTWEIVFWISVSLAGGTLCAFGVALLLHRLFDAAEKEVNMPDVNERNYWESGQVREIEDRRFRIVFKVPKPGILIQWDDTKDLYWVDERWIVDFTTPVAPLALTPLAPTTT